MSDIAKIANDKQYKLLIIVTVGAVVVVVGYLLFKAAGAGGSLLDAIKKLFGAASGGISKVTDSVGLTTSETAKEADIEASDPASPWNVNYMATVPTSVMFSLGTKQDYSKIGDQIADAFGIFSDDADSVLSAIHQISSKAQLSYLVSVFLTDHNADLLNYIRGGGGILPWDGLSDSHLQTVLDYVKSLPKY